MSMENIVMNDGGMDKLYGWLPMLQVYLDFDDFIIKKPFEMNNGFNEWLNPLLPLLELKNVGTTFTIGTRWMAILWFDHFTLLPLKCPTK